MRIKQHKKMKRNRLKEFFGYKFIVNSKTKEIHRVKVLQSNCRIECLRNGYYTTKRRANKLLNDGFNGCRYCFKEEDRG